MAVKNIRAGRGKQSTTGIAEEPVKVAAYYIWEKEGRPDGDDLRHWYLAIAELSSNGAFPPTTRAAKKATIANRKKITSIRPKSK
jgi:Protein of unknown function (DUF2934)